MDFKGKVAIVTGSSRGLGYAIADALLDRGCNVCISGISIANGEKALQKLSEKYSSDRVMFVQCDVCDAAQQEELFKKTIIKFKKLDILVNNAGIASEKRWEQMVDTNVKGVMRGTFLGLKYMDKNNGGNGGTIINMGSDGSIVVADILPSYGATKFAVKAFTEAIGLTSLERYGVQVNGICPGWVATEMGSKSIDPKYEEDLFYGPGACAKAKKSQEEEGIATAEDVATACIQMIENQDVNGQFLLVMVDQKALVPPATSFPEFEFTPIHKK